MEASANIRPRASTSRPKPQLSCKLCRVKKLKCSREQPCQNCAKLPLGSCVYVSSGRKVPLSSSSVNARSGGTPTDLDDRIKRLERLVSSALAGKSTPNSESNGLPFEDPPSENATIDQQVREPSPHLDVEGEETRFLDSSHWESILNEIAGVKDDLNSSGSSPFADDSNSSIPDRSVGPQLLFNARNNLSAEELICSVPSKSVADTLINMITSQANTPVLLIVIHFPTFWKEYKAYWANPRNVSLTWLSMLYSMMSFGLQIISRTGGNIEGIPLPEPAAYTYTTRAAQCLLCANYTKPTKYTVEAVCMYVATEHLWSEEGHFQASLVFNTVLRLAMRMGYHRDPRHYPSMSIFESEFRRRIWTFLTHVDLLVARKCGLPRMIDERKTDTSRPINVLDEDLDPDMTEPPRPRPDTEPTMIGALNYKTRLLALQGRIVDQSSSPNGLMYSEVLELEKNLVEEIAERPAWLEPPARDNLGDFSPNQLLQVLEVDLIAQCTRMMLHRKYIVPARTHAKYSYSREVCLAAARKALGHQQLLYEDCRQKESTQNYTNWRFISLVSHDLLLAAVLICLDLEQDSKHGLLHTSIMSQETKLHLQLLKESYDIWTDFGKYTATSLRAAMTLKTMVDRFQAHEGLSTGCERRFNTQNAFESNGNTHNINSTSATRTQGMETTSFLRESFTDPPPMLWETKSTAQDFNSANFEGMDFTSYNLDQGFEGIQNILGNSEFELEWPNWDSQFPGMI